MSIRMGGSALRAREIFMIVAQGFILAFAALLLTRSIAAGLGWLAWPRIDVVLAGEPLPMAGMWLQLGVTAVAVLLALFLPAVETGASPRRARRSTPPVTRATPPARGPALVTVLDTRRPPRQPLPALADLRHLETGPARPGRAADGFSDETVHRIETILKRRQEAAQAMSGRVALAQSLSDELRRWLGDVKAKERAAQSQMRRLEADLKEILPALGYHLDADDLRGSNVIRLPRRGA